MGLDHDFRFCIVYFFYDCQCAKSAWTETDCDRGIVKNRVLRLRKRTEVAQNES